MYNGDKLSITIILKIPVSISGYGFRTADDCPGRDPRKWSIKFYLPKKQTFEESILFEGVETPEWLDRF